jgi:hypothetical protein
MSFAIPRFRIVIPPGSNENGKPIAAHWIVSQNGRIVPGTTIVIIGGFRFNKDAKWYAWFPYENHHTEAYSGDPSDPDGVGWPLGVSPMQFDLCDGYIKIYTKGAGTQGVVNGLLQPVDVERHEFPVDATKRIMLKPVVDYRTISRTTHHWSKSIARVEAWIGERGKDMIKYVDEKVPTMYTNEQLMSAYTGVYTDIHVGSGNEGRTIDFDYILPRMAPTFAEARALVPTVQGEWGALSKDMTQGLVNGHLPPYTTVDSEDWKWPSELIGATAPPVVPISPPEYTVTQTVKTNTNPDFRFKGVFRWFENTSHDVWTARVEFFDNGVNVMGRPETTLPFGCTNVPGAASDQGEFDTTLIEDGLHLMQARATHKDGRYHSVTASIIVENNPAPVPPEPTVDVEGAIVDLNSALVKLGA